MKKLFFIAGTVTLLTACTSDQRTDEIIQEDNVLKNSEVFNKISEGEKNANKVKGDTIEIKNLEPINSDSENGDNLDSGLSIDPNEGGDPKDGGIVPPKR